MKLSDAELVAFRDRCHKAAVRGYTVAHAGLYQESLTEETGETDPPAGAAPGSAAHLASLAQAAVDVRSGAKKAKPKKAAPKPAAPPPPPEPDPEPDPEDDEDEGESDEDLYENWDMKELYKVAQECEIPGRSNMSKDELVAALYEWDEEHAEDGD